MQSVDRALSILEILARRQEAGVTEIGKELGVHKSTAFRLLAVLENRGFAEQTVELRPVRQRREGSAQVALCKTIEAAFAAKLEPLAEEGERHHLAAAKRRRMTQARLTGKLRLAEVIHGAVELSQEGVCIQHRVGSFL